MPSKQLEDNFDLLPDGVIVCDREGKILRANAAALKLFEVASEDLCRGVDYQQFLHGSIMDDGASLVRNQFTLLLRVRKCPQPLSRAIRQRCQN